MGIGQNTYKVLNFPQYTSSPQKAAEHVWKMGKKQIAANGAVMRTAILGTWDYELEHSVESNTIEVCKFTHADPRCIGSCVIITSLIRSLLLEEELTFNELKTIADKYDERIVEYIQLAENGAIELLDLSNETNWGYTLKTMAVGLWAYKNAVNYQDGINQVIMQGGDADTNASDVGAILGTMVGYSNLPKDLIDGLRYKSVLVDKSEQYLNILTNCIN